MKRILNILLLGMIFNVNNINLVKENNEIIDITKPAVCVEGEDYQEKFNYDGYKIIENNVNYNLPGRYNIVYEDLKANRFIKPIDIVSKESISNMTYTFKEEQELFKNDYYMEYVIGTLEYNNLNYLLYTFKDQDTDKTNVSLLIKEKEEIIKNISLSTDGSLKLIKMLGYKDHLLLVGTKYKSSTNHDIYVLELNKYGDFINSFIIEGNDYDEVKDAIILNDKLYINGLTSSTDGYFRDVCDQDMFIFKVNPLSGSVEECYISTEVSTETVSNLITIEDNLYFTHGYKENEYFHEHLVSLNCFLEFNKEIDLGIAFELKIQKLLEHNNLIYMFYSDRSNVYDKLIGGLYTFDQDLFYTSSRTFILENYPTVYTIDMAISSDGIVSLLFELLNQNYERGYCLLQLLGDETILNVTTFNNQSPLKFGDDKGNLFFVRKNNKVEKIQINSILVKDFGSKIIDDNKNVQDIKVLINSKYELPDKNLSDLNYDLNHFGNYRLIYGFETSDIIFLYHLDTYLKDNINICPDENYDLYFTLKFNGDGKLNEKPVNSGYVIKDEGKYTLEVEGNNSIRKIITFSISKNTKDIVLENEVYIYPNYNHHLENTENLVTVDLEQDRPQQVGQPKDNNWLYLIPLICLTTSFFLIWKVR